MSIQLDLFDREDRTQFAPVRQDSLARELHRLAGLNAGAIMADPGIGFKAYSPKGEGRSPQRHYRCSLPDELAALPIAEIAAPNCFLFLWMPLRSVFLVEPLMDAWGWQFSGSAFGWLKLNKDIARLRRLFEGRNVIDCIADPRLWFMGGGFGTRHNLEICWLGRRNSPRRLNKGVREPIVAPRREHSRKPDEAYARVEALCAGPYVEIFARQRWPKWISIGDEIDKFQSKRRHSEDLQLEAMP
jgi:N6-adenosine-specific RNA methylase IME4